MLVCGDIHGNYAKAKAFLEYKPEEEHCFVGDYTDSFKATDEEIIKTMELIFESDAVVLAGNHDNQYFRFAGHFTKCSVYRVYSADLFVNVIEKYKNKIKAAHVVDDHIIVHGGIHSQFGRAFDNIEDICNYCNKEFEMFKITPPSRTYSSIFNISGIRGGWDQYSGIFWATYGYEKFDHRFNIVCGHTHKKDPRMMPIGKIARSQHVHVCVDCDSFTCYNTKTKQFEDFIPEELKSKRHSVEILF